ncbi:MAG TPA: glycerol-3-phosphate dehydrogenase/oxidase [Verrucomicrobiae bacterium]|nr:glycerol-3-phosphate dehydrogenase/oxidase [Verrucomicrobiae bacterium]
MLKRAQGLKSPWAFVIIGGGATGMGIALDAASRGYRVLLLEQSDFGKGTSSRSTKLVHGGVRYLEQGNIALVMEALKERGLLRQNAPHLVNDLAFVVPSYAWWEAPFYGLGLKLYQALSGKYGFGKSHLLSRRQTLQRLPNIQTEGLRGGVVYYDGQFDDARLLINLAMTAAEQGAVLLNYVQVTGLRRDKEGLVCGVAARDLETGRALSLRASVVINAAGAFCDAVRAFAEPKVEPMIRPSQGAHLVFDRSFLPGDSAIMVPHTSDGRVMFAIPWHGHTLVGTTDTPVQQPALEPVPLRQEIEFILSTARLYLHKAPSRADVLSAFAGIRPLVKSGEGASTAGLSRDHTIHIDPSGLLTITGGKWTTYRHMAEGCVDQAATLAHLADKPCRTRDLRIHGYHRQTASFGSLAIYGSDAPAIQRIARERPGLETRLHPDLPYIEAEVLWAAREEMARTVEDVLARRTRALFLNARAALAMAPRVAALLAEELGQTQAWQTRQLDAFAQVAAGYVVG